MRSPVKAGLATVAGVALLLGSAGSLAYWNDTENPAGGTTVSSGELDLGTPDCGSGWLLDDGSGFTPASDTIVPGDSLTMTCTMLISATGEHLTAELTATSPAVQDTDGLDDELALTAAWETDTNATDGDTVSSTETAITPAAGAWDFTEADDGLYLRVTLELDFPFGSLDNDSNGGIDAVLDGVSVTATQTDDEHP